MRLARALLRFARIDAATFCSASRRSPIARFRAIPPETLSVIAPKPYKFSRLRPQKPLLKPFIKVSAI